MHPDKAYRMAAALIDFRDERDAVYLISPHVAKEMPGEFMMSTLYTTITRQGVVLLWPVRLPPPDGRHNEWHRSAAEAAELAMTRWIRVKANLALGAYEMFEAAGTIPEPEWPRETLRRAAADRLHATAWLTASTIPSSGGCAGCEPMLEALPYREVWAVDFEFMAPPGERQIPVCLVARELRSGRTIRLWQDQFGPTPPFPISADVLFVAYYASAELGCFRALGWPMPARILDLFTEFRDATNGLPTPAGAGLLGALTYFGLDAIGATEKDEMRDLVLRGGPWSSDGTERNPRLLRERRRGAGPTAAGHAVRASICRVRWCAAATWRRPRSWNTPGFRSTSPTLALLREHWTDIQDQLIAAIDVDYHVFDGRTFKHERFEAWLARAGIPWPLLESGQLDLSDDTFRRAAKSYPVVSPLRELRSALADLRLNELAVGRDGRNRTILSAFRSRTGRNQPSNSKSSSGRASGCAG